MNNKAGVLIYALWVLSFLAVLAANLGYGVRQKMTFIKRIEERSQANHTASDGIKTAIALLIAELQKSQFQYSPASKAFRHNNPKDFADIKLSEGSSEISYLAPIHVRQLEKRYGVVDEESKININFADKFVLKRIIGLALAIDEEASDKIAGAIFDWRQLGESEVKGFFSDDYYSNLQFPYPKKSEPFELMDELLLVKGIDQRIFETLSHYVTVYGQGQVNINTASKSVLIALGMTETVADKILNVRRGTDGVEATPDDHIFYRTFDIAAEVSRATKMEESEMRMIDQLNVKGLLTINSYYYRIQGVSFPNHSRKGKNITCVFNAGENRIVYWQEK